MKLHLDSLEWGRYGDAGCHQFYFIWAPNWLARENRHLGLMRYWYDGPHVVLGFWFFNIGWSTQFTIPPFEFLNSKYKEIWRTRPDWLRRLLAMEEYSVPRPHRGKV